MMKLEINNLHLKQIVSSVLFTMISPLVRSQNNQDNIY